MSKILSVIVPTYNMERYLDKCLGSLIINNEMLFQRLEVLVIIDGATDQSSAIAHSYQARYPEVFIVVDKTNGNYGSCINMGLDLATGKYIKVLDADDSFDTKSLEGYLKFLQSVDEDMITVFDILTPLCEILSERVTYIIASTECPADLRAQLDSILYASTRVEIPEFQVLAFITSRLSFP